MVDFDVLIMIVIILVGEDFIVENLIEVFVELFEKVIGCDVEIIDVFDYFSVVEVICVDYVDIGIMSGFFFVFVVNIGEVDVLVVF